MSVAELRKMLARRLASWAVIERGQHAGSIPGPFFDMFSNASGHVSLGSFPVGARSGWALAHTLRLRELCVTGMPNPGRLLLLTSKGAGTGVLLAIYICKCGCMWDLEFCDRDHPTESPG